MKYIFFYKYQINQQLVCKFGIAEESADGGADGNAAKSVAAGTICGIFFDCVSAPNGYEKRETPLIKKAAEQLGEYFEGGRKSFNLPLSLHGTDFQIKVWNALQNIPYGKTLSYGELAAITGNPKASRAVGMANNRNPIPIIIPCHRVIGKDGSLTGYAGGLELKRQLLALENK
jgi:methylated-DNA-[protein]-cysteine S-methyltransferase